MLLSRLLRQYVREGSLRVVDAAGRAEIFGEMADPRVTVRLLDRWTEYRVALRPTLAVGEAYMDGRLIVEEGTLYDLLEILSANYKSFDRMPIYALSHRLSRLWRGVQQFNPIPRARANVAHHYDLSGELYDLFLDPDRQYSCAYFLDEDDGLEQAQEAKKRHIAAKLLLEPGQRILDIGSGWGGLGLSLAQAEDVEVTGLTLSEEQYRLAEQRARDAGLSSRLRFALCDYREASGTYDRIVSVGMFEHVGVRHYRAFFRKVKQLLDEDGVMLLHSIGRMEAPGSSNAWMRKYIFPGGYTPALSEVLRAVEAAGLWVTDIEILRLHYADTLRAWRQRFAANRDEVARIYDQRFCRMWEYYLTGCECAFRNMNQMVFQMQITRHQDAVPLVRDYITDWERAEAEGKTIAA